MKALKNCWMVLAMIIGGNLSAQITIGYCPNLDSKEPPVVKSGQEFLPSQKVTCGSYCTATCEEGLVDPIGGFEVGYYLFKDKALEKWKLCYRIGDDPETIRTWLAQSVETDKRKLQDRKEGFAVVAVPMNRQLPLLQDELQHLVAASKDDFKALVGKSEPLGDFAGLFASMVVSPQEARLTLRYRVEGRSQAIFDTLAATMASLMPQYEVQRLTDTLAHFHRNPEFSTLDLIGSPSRREVQLVVLPPQLRDAPELLFTFDQLRYGRQGIDTLLSSKLRNGGNGYVIGLRDQSQIHSFRFEKAPVPITTNEDGKLAVIEARPELNLKTITLDATDEHGNQVSKRVFLLAHETEPPRIGLLNPTDNSYLVPGDLVVLDKFGARFELRGKVADASPIRMLRINGQPVEVDESNLFSHGLKPADNNKQMVLEAVDAIGNRKTQRFTLQFKESGADRNMRRAIVDENFATENKAHLLRNGEQGLQLKIRDGRFYLQRQLPPDTGSSGGNAALPQELPAQPRLAIAPFGFQTLDFNADFELQVAYKQVEDQGGFIFTFGLNSSMDSYFFLYGERGNLFLGQMENGKEQCLGEGCPQNAFNRVYATYPYLARATVKPNFFELGTGVEYKLTIRRYNQFYVGGLDDPQDYLFVRIDNGIDKAEELRFKLAGGNARIAGTQCGFGLQDRTHIAVSKFTFRNGDAATKPAFFDDRETERYCMPACFKVDSTKHQDFFDCLADDYHALIVANGDFGGRHNPLDSAVVRGRQLQHQLIDNYQFPVDHVKLLENATRQEFEALIDKWYPDHLTGKDRLLIYVISHGTLDKHIAFKDIDLSATYLWSVLQEKKGDGTDKYKCKQVLVAFDACYSGEMAPTKQMETNPNRQVCDAYTEPSRLLLTSASNSPTRDSELTKAIIERLDRHHERFITIDKLFDLAGDDFSKAMQGNSKPTLTIFQPGFHQPNGSFLFVKKKFYQ